VWEVVTLDARDTEIVALHADVARLEKRVAILATVVRLIVTLVRVSGVTLAGVRVPSASGKRRVLHAVARAERRRAVIAGPRVNLVQLDHCSPGTWAHRERARLSKIQRSPTPEGVNPCLVGTRSREVGNGHRHDKRAELQKYACPHQFLAEIGISTPQHVEKTVDENGYDRQNRERQNPTKYVFQSALQAPRFERAMVGCNSTKPPSLAPRGDKQV